MLLFMWIDVDHDVPHVGKPLEDELLDVGGNVVGLFDRHFGIHVQLQVHDQVLPGSPTSDLVDMLDAGHPFRDRGDGGSRRAGWDERSHIDRPAAGRRTLPAGGPERPGGRSNPAGRQVEPGFLRLHPLP